ncbi:MAG TPA: HAD family hydrolase [Acidimicrobiales bacterium]
MTSLSAGSIDAVLFDFGHTLFGHATGAEVVRVEAARLGTDLTVAEAAAIWKEIDDASNTAEEIARGRDLDATVWADRWKVLYGLADRHVAGLGAEIDRAYHGAEDWLPYADTADTLGRLGELGIAVGIASNTGWDVRGPFLARGYERWIRSFTLSCECRSAKPDAGIFLTACEEVGAAPARTLMVGDNPVADGGATAAGLAGVVIVDPRTPLETSHGFRDALAPWVDLA